MPRKIPTDLLELVQRRQAVREAIVLLDGEILIAARAYVEPPMLVHAAIGALRLLQAELEAELKGLLHV